MPTWLIALDRHRPILHLILLAVSLLRLLCGHAGWGVSAWTGSMAVLGALGGVIGIRDLRQTPAGAAAHLSCCGSFSLFARMDPA